MDYVSHIWPEWKITEHIGSGSYGNVYKAVRDEYENPVYSAIKIISIPDSMSEVTELRTEGLDDKALKEYFRQKVKSYISEIELMETFKGTPNIVNIEDYKVVEKKDKIGFDILIRMELLIPFNRYIKNNVLTNDEIIKLGIDVCTALEMFEQKQIIHRDIKPENLFISDYGDFKVGDLGVARKLAPDITSLSAKGTYYYMAPEVINGKIYNITADVYSLGIVLYKLCNKNRFPFVNVDSDEINIEERKNITARRLKGEKIPKPANAAEDMSAVILKACEYYPDKRFKTPTEFKNALIAVSKGEKIILDKKNNLKSKNGIIVGISVFFLFCITGVVLILGKAGGGIQVVQTETECEKYETSQQSSVQNTDKDTTEVTKSESIEAGTTEKGETTVDENTEISEIETIEKETIEKETTEKETTPKETTEKETNKNETTGNETAGNETTKNETTKAEITEDETKNEEETVAKSEQTDIITQQPTDETKEQNSTGAEKGFIVPKGARYYDFSEGTEYKEGMCVNVKPELNDHLYTEDYTYRYINYSINLVENYNFIGWSVEVNDNTKSEYEALLDNIAGEKLTIMVNTYSNCENMKKIPSIPEGVELLQGTYLNCRLIKESPVIPKSVTAMSHTFNGCSSLEEAPEIPGSVKHWEYIFRECTNLTKAPKIPSGVCSLNGTFGDCTSLAIAPVIPDSVVSMKYTFENCISLKEPPNIPSNVKNMEYTFFGCQSLKETPRIPEGVTSLESTFYDCNRLTRVTNIPNSVTNMSRTFFACKKLSEIPKIPDGVTDMSRTFVLCERLYKAPEIPSSVINMERTFSECRNLKSAPVIPSSVTNMDSTFYNCEALTGEVVINANPALYSECFGKVDFRYQNLTLTGNSTMLEELRSTGTN